MRSRPWTSQQSRPELRANIRASVGAQVSQLRFQRRQERAHDLETVERAIATGTAGPGTERLVDSLHASGAYSAEDRANTLAQIDASHLQAAKANAGAAEISRALAAGLPLDPKDADQRKALDSYFTAGTLDTPLGSEPWRAAALTIANKTRMLPDSALAWTRMALRSPSADLASTAAQFYGATAVAAPDAVSGFDDDTKTFAAMVNGMIEAGAAPKAAVEVARANVFDVQPATRDARKHAWSGAGKLSLRDQSATALDAFIDRDFDSGLFADQPAATDPRVARAAGALQILPAFTAQTDRYFQKSGDITLAREQAWADVRRVYGVSEVNGTPQMFAFPPEQFGVTPTVVRADVEAFLKAAAQPDGSTAEDVVLVPDGQTLRLVGDALTGQVVRPSYLLVGKSGTPVIGLDGVRKRYTIPSSEEISKRIRAAQASAVDLAKAQRDKVRRGYELANKLSQAH
jgi:hypothetical protein